MYRWLGPVLVVLPLVGCRLADDTPPDLLTIADIAPREAELGDNIDVLGASFPEGASGIVTFRGDLHRPGETATPGVVISIPTKRTTRDRISFAITDRVQAEFCGSDARARHTTFRGEVAVAFAPKRSGAPPVMGRLGEVVLDIDGPTLPDDVVRIDKEKSQRVLGFVGLTLESPRREGSALIVGSVMPSSRADWIGLKSGDQLLELNGVRLRTAEDLLVRPGQRTAVLTFKRGRLPEPVRRELDIDGFEAAAPPELEGVAALIGIAVAVTAIFVAPVGRVLSWVARRLSVQLSSVRLHNPGRNGAQSWIRELLGSPWVDELLPAGVGWGFRLVPYLLFLGIGAVTAVVSIRGRLCAEDLDVVLVALGSGTSLLSGGLLLAGACVPRGWSLLAGLRMVASLAVLQIPVILALASAAIVVGSLRPAELMQNQGPWPWQWLAFRSPFLLTAFLLLLPSALTTALDTSGADPHRAIPDAEPTAGPARHRPMASQGKGKPAHGVRANSRGPNGFLRGVMFASESLQLCAIAFIAALVFLGGAAIPGHGVASELGLSVSAMSRTEHILGWVVLQSKCWGVAMLLLWLRWTLPRVSAPDVWRIAVLWLWSLSGGALLLSWALEVGRQLPYLRSLREGLVWVTLGVSLFVALDFARRVVRGLTGSRQWGGVNPWL